MVNLFRQIRKYVARGVLRTEIASSIPLEQFQLALQQAADSRPDGKILLRLNQA
jgi:NADPH:quinone reductase-like Zn-dependent oxidoreductase